MKTRNGFVSNSSSSSFVVIGTRIPRKELEEMGWFDPECGDTDNVPDGISIYYDEGGDGWIVGIPIAVFEDWGLVGNEMTQQEIGETFLNVKSKLPSREVKLLMGTRPT